MFSKKSLKKMNSPNFAIVVLNYMNYQDTIECVESLLEQNYEKYQIIIIENGSSNDSFIRLTEVFGLNTKIFLLKSETNLGFAKGNNIGIRYAVKSLSSDFVFVLNSDTIVNKNLLRSIANTDLQDNIGVISPTITDEFGNIQVPDLIINNLTVFTLKSCYKLLLTIILNNKFIYRLHNEYNTKIKKIRPLTVENNYQKEVNNATVKYSMQGCAYFLTPNFFKFFNNIHPNTFLYWEEINLIWYIHKVNLRAILIDTPPVFHKGSKSVSLQTTKDRLNKWKLSMSLQSMIRSIPMFFMNYKHIKKTYN
jgi:GT2 family glycosyltransferase